MPFPLGGDYTKDVDTLFKIVSTDRRICEHDNGTDLCDLGHMLKVPGTCFNQSRGTFNSSDPLFQPDFPVCFVDYESLGFDKGNISSATAPEAAFISANTIASGTGNYKASNLLRDVASRYKVFKASISDAKTTFIENVSNQVASSSFEQQVPSVVSSFWKMVQFNPGVIPHLPGVFSGLFAFDVFSGFIVYNRLVRCMIERLGVKFQQIGLAGEMSHNLVQTDFYTTISGQSDVCVEDNTPPFITYLSPTISGAKVRPRNQIIDFSLTDPIAGVDISTVFIDLTSTNHGSFSLVAAGADQTGGDVGIIGDPSSYQFTYTPPFSWEFNELVTVTISGADLPTLVGGQPFICGDPGVNHFLGDFPFQVLNQEDFPASITPLGDVSPPYISFASPASGTSNNDVFTSVIIDVSDDFTGVNLASLFVNVGGTTIIQNGLSTTSEATITGAPSVFQIIYKPTKAFTYGSTVQVIVNAEDRAGGTPNFLAATYDFSFISDSTLIIENFLPAVGTNAGVKDLDIVVDVRDDTFGVDVDQTFLVVNGTIVISTQTPITNGIRLRYHPPNDFNFEEPIRVTVHGTNGNIAAPVVKEAFFTLYHGLRVLHFNDNPFEHSRQISVFVRARNVELLHKDLSTGYFFTTYTQPQSDLYASICAVNKSASLSATLNVLAPEHRYGKTVTVEFFVEDFDGHELGPYTFTYTIEDRPA